jgi:hypothetical protein
MGTRILVSEAKSVAEAMRAVSQMLNKLNKTGTPLVLGLLDFNTPNSTFKDRVDDHVTFIARFNALSPDRAAIIVTMPDRAKATGGNRCTVVPPHVVMSAPPSLTSGKLAGFRCGPKGIR